MPDLHPAFVVAGEHPADRIWTQIRRGRGDLDLAEDEPRPTRGQVAAVLRTLADHTLNQHMLSEWVRALGASSVDAPINWPAVGLGRWFHGLADHLGGRHA